MSEKKMPIGQDETSARHQQTVQESKKDLGAATRAQIANKALVVLAELRDQEANGMGHFDDDGNAVDVDHALARILAGRTVHVRESPVEVEVRVTKGPILEEKS